MASTTADSLSQSGHSWRIYAGDLTPQVAALKHINVFDVWHYGRFASDVASSGYDVDYTWIEPSYGHVWSNYSCGTSQHPLDEVTRGERLLKCTYEALRASPVWDTSLLIVTWDEHGGFYDGGIPVGATPPGDKPPHDYSTHDFAFDQYGVRVPAVVASPLVPQNLIDHRVYDHSSIPATLEDLFDLEPLTERDAAAQSALALASLPSPRDTPAGALYVAYQRDMGVTPSAERPARQARLRSIASRADARDYLEEVRQRYLAGGRHFPRPRGRGCGAGPSHRCAPVRGTTWVTFVESGPA